MSQLPDSAAVVVNPALQLPDLLQQQQEHATELKKKRLRVFIFRFLAAWVAFIVVLVGFSLLTNLEWARPRVEQEMSQSFHRKVKLGWLSWTLGLNGLAIATNKLAMMEADGKPFIVSGPSEIGIAFTPLFRKRLIIKYVDIHNPDVFATQLAPGKWNFSDLLVEGPEIRYVQVDDGRLHLRNLITEEQLQKTALRTNFSNTKWRQYDFQAVNIKLIFPKRNQRRPWPFYLSFQLPGSNSKGPYTSKFSLTLMGNGTLEQWKKRNCSVDVRCEKMNPADWSPLFAVPAGVTGLFDFKFKGDGVISNLVSGHLNGVAQDLSIEKDGKVVFTAPQAQWESKVGVHHDYLTWHDLKIGLAGLTLLSEGRINDWHKADPSYAATVKADLHKLAELTDTAFWRFIPGFAADKPRKPEMSGAAQVEVKLQSDGKKQKIYTTIKANGVPFGNLVSNGTTGSAPFLSLFAIEPNAPIKGQIEIGHDQRILLKDIQVPAKGSTLHIEGFVDAVKRQQEITVKATNLPLHKLDSNDLEFQSTGKKHINSSEPPVMLSGKIDLDGLLKQDGNKQTVAVKAHLKQAVLSAGADVLATGLTGDIVIDGANMRFVNMVGVLVEPGKSSGGSFTLNGAVSMNNGQCSIEFMGHHLDLGQLSTFARSAHISLPDFVRRQMHGSVRELNVTVKGSSSNPAVALYLVPEEFYYQVASSAGGPVNQPLKITSGVITSNGSRIELKDLVVHAQSGKLALSGIFEGAQSEPKTVHLKTAGIDIAELRQYLRSKVLAEDLYKKLESGLAPLSLAHVQGKMSGDLNVNFVGQSQNIEGKIGFQNLSGQTGAGAGPFEHLSGTVLIANNTLTLQELTATSGASRFSFLGEIKNYQQAPSWNLQLNGSVRPQDLMPLLPLAFDAKNVITAAGPLNTHSTISGDGNSQKIVFTAKAEPADKLNLKSAFGGLSQPDKQTLVLDGTLLVNSGSRSSIQAQNCHLVIGESVIQTSGKYEWSADGKTPPNVEFAINTPVAVPTALVVAALWPGTDVTGSAGSIKANIAVAGESGNMLRQGDAVLSHVVLPSMNIKDLNGKLHTPRWAVLRNAQTTDDTMRSEAKVELTSAILSGLPARDVVALIVLENGPEPRISISRGTATLAGGTATIDAQYLPQSGRWHLDLGLSKLYVDQFISDLIEHSGEVTGLADGKISLDGSGHDFHSIMVNAHGHGEIAVYKGTVPRVGQLQEKLTHANLLQQGIFGFNINNVFQTVLPVKAGNFKEASVYFEIANGIINLERMDFNGNDLRLRAAGKWNMLSNTIDIDVAGNIPRVASSILPGAVGEVSRHFTIQKAVRVVTFNKLENLPSVPILGDIGKDDPRAFTFKVGASLDQPAGITQSIGKTFKWLPNKPNASAHPIPGQAI